MVSKLLIKTLSLSTFSIKGKPIFSNGPKNLPKNPSDCPILCDWDFDYYVLSYKSFEIALQSIEACALVNNNLCWKLVSSLEIPI